MKRILLYKDFLKESTQGYETINDYKIEHEAPTKADGYAPLYNLSGIYPDDIYSYDALRLYGTNEDSSIDRESLYIIQDCKGKPKKMVTIYRAITDLNKDISIQIKELSYILSYKAKFSFFPKSVIIDELRDKYPIEEISYDKREELVTQDINDKIDALSKQRFEYPKIKAGDWVSLSRKYAVQHGKYNLKNTYKIISKSVATKTLYTDGNDINEWGYNPE